MCRWLAYSGSPVTVYDLLYRPQHSLIDQSLHSTLGVETTNGDGFGIGWYGTGETPGVFHSVEPAWNDRNLRELAGAHRVAARVRAHSRFDRDRDPADELPPVPPRPLALDAQRRHPRVPEVKRDLVLAVDPSLFPEMEGSTDTEVFFYLALSLGLEDDPPSAVEEAVGLIEEVGRRHGVEDPMPGTVATTDGERIWAFRYSSERQSRSLFYSTDVPTLRELHPELEILEGLSDESRLVVSEPLRDLPGAWNEVPESSYGVVQEGQDELHPFTPRVPTRPVSVPVQI